MTWTAKTFLQWSAACLTGAKIESARLESEVLLAGALRFRREDIHKDPDRRLAENEYALSRSYVERRLRREPVAYILGRREFWGMEFRVTPAVLVPRWETEILIEQFLNWVRSGIFTEAFTILDIGTGSGIIAVAAAKELPHSRVTAVDISPAALEVARENARRHGVLDRIEFIQSDLFQGVTGRFDAILSNPPYIETEVMNTLMPDVKDFEPHAALNGGRQGLDFYTRIVPGAWPRLKETGALFLEIGHNQAAAVASLVENHGGYQLPRVAKDYSGCDRVISAQKCEHG